MSTTLRHILLAVCGVLCLALVVSRLVSDAPARQADLPDGVEFVCEPGGHETRFTKQQLSDFYQSRFGQPLRCPACDSERMVRAVRNSADGKLYRLGRRGPAFANKNVTPETERP